MPVIAVILALQVGSQPKINEHHWLVVTTQATSLPVGVSEKKVWAGRTPRPHFFFGFTWLGLSSYG